MTPLPPVLAKARAQLVAQAPFFGSIALRLAWRRDPAVLTMATDGRTIFYDAGWCEDIGVRRAMGVIAHEVLHVVHKHHLRRRGREPGLWNVAADLVINAILLAAGYELPAAALVDPGGRFAGLGVETVYERLRQERAVPHREGAGAGTMGPAWGEVRDAIGAAGRQALAEAEVDRMLRQALAAARRAGKLPAALEAMIEAIPGRIDWRDRFRRLTDGLMAGDPSWARPNRRFLPHGLYLPSTRCRGIGTIAVALDTSGSITAAELAAYTGEVLGLLEEARPEELVLIQCDTEVRTVERLRPGERFEGIKVVGRGGTRFQPAFDWIGDQAPEARSIVYMTDLAGADRPEDPGVPVIWLSPCHHRRMPFGEIVHLAPEPQG